MTRVLRRLLLVICISPALVLAAFAQGRTTAKYVCPMHAEVTSTAPGRCSRCNMELVAVSHGGAVAKRRRPVNVKRRAIAANRKTSPSPSPNGAPRSRRPLTAAERLREMERLAPTLDYTCVMHRDIHQAQEGACPICGMQLVSVDPSIRGAYKLVLTPTPRKAKPGQNVRLRFEVFNPQTGVQVKRFVLNHEKLFHLFVVSEDMNDYQHIHPQLGPDGSFTVETSLPRPGLYKLHSDFFPIDGTPQVIRQELVTAGHRRASAAPARLTLDTTLTKTIDGIKINLTLGGSGKPAAGSFVPLKYHLTDAESGAPIRDLEPYLGAWGHTLILNADQSAYLHSHPSEMLTAGAGSEGARGGPDVEFGAMFPEAGNYRIWTQVQRDGKVLTVSFTIGVLPENSALDR